MPLWLRGKKDFHYYRWPMPVRRSAFTQKKWCVKQLRKASYFGTIGASLCIESWVYLRVIANGRTTVHKMTNRPKIQTLKQRQTILTGDQKHTAHIATRQHLNRHADQRYVFYFFPTAQKKILPTHNWHICKPHKPTHKPKLAKEPILPPATSRQSPF